MKKTLSCIIGILLLTSILTLAFNIESAEFSEPPKTEWSRTYGWTDQEDERDLIKTSDGGYAVVGCTRSFGVGGLDFWLVKTNSTGHMEWNRTYGGSSDDFAWSVVQTVDGGYALAGYTLSFGAGSGDFWLVKTNSTGHMEWNRTYGGSSDDRARSIVQTVDGGYLLSGYTWSFSAGANDFWLVKTNSTGHMEWNRTYGGSGQDVVESVVLEAGGDGYVIAGHTSSYGAGGKDFWLVKTNSTGHMEWSRTYGGPEQNYAESVTRTMDGGYAIAGYAWPFGAGGKDFWLVKTNSTGHMEWSQPYGGAAEDVGRSVVQTVDGGYAIVGHTQSFGAGGKDFWLVKTNSTGHMEWNKPYGELPDDIARSVVQTVDGGYAIAGHTKSYGAGNMDFWLIKLAPSEISATVDIAPETLNLKSNGEWITAYVTLPEGHLVESVDVNTVELVHNDFLLNADWGEVQDGVLMVKFDRGSLRDHLGEVDVDDGDKFYDVTLTVKGEVAGTPFEGSDTITVKRK